MISRRSFLEANLGGLLASRVVSRSLVAGSSLSTESLAPDLGSRDYWNDWPVYFARRMAAARDRRKAELAGLRTPEQINQRIAAVRSRLWEILGGQPARTPLNARVVGTIDRSQYRIEKIIFESQPEVYVTAHLYVPKSVTGAPSPFPGILAPLGHAPEGKRYRSYQHA